jgi:murein DD-endopeptidase MepM/ murein hydrolase activator NlpD
MNITPMSGSSRHALLSNIDYLWRYAMPLLTLLALSMLLVYGGYRYGTSKNPTTETAALKLSLQDQRVLLEKARVDMHANVDALTQRIGLLQAHINRINALGSRLVTMANIDAKEFDFLNTPAMGGPENGIGTEGYESDEINKVLDLLELQLLEKEQQLALLDDVLIDKTLQDKTKPEGSPVVDGWMSSPYGYRSDPFTGKRQFHHGVDFAAAEGGPIFTVASGIVSRIKRHKDYGNMVEIDHGNGYTTRYAHTSRILVSTGQVVNRGQQIAEIGNTGRSTGPHVHFEVLKQGETINPSSMIGG